nr:hypothetical protein [uncultured bacterium]BAJ07050.1 hypothetical protein [uncultured bacterium]
MRILITVICFYAVFASAQSPTPADSPSWNTDASSDARCHIFDREARPLLEWFSTHPDALDSWLEGLQTLCFTDSLARSELQREFAHQVYMDMRSQILDRVQPYQEDPELGAVASRIVAAAHSLEIPYR